MRAALTKRRTLLDVIALEQDLAAVLGRPVEVLTEGASAPTCNSESSQKPWRRERRPHLPSHPGHHRHRDVHQRGSRRVLRRADATRRNASQTGSHRTSRQEACRKKPGHAEGLRPEPGLPIQDDSHGRWCSVLDGSVHQEPAIRGNRVLRPSRGKCLRRWPGALGRAPRAHSDPAFCRPSSLLPEPPSGARPAGAT
jgi:hypothetical protein